MLRRIGSSMAWFITALMIGICAAGQSASTRGLHYAPNRNFDSRGNYLPGKLGFNLADVSDSRQLDALPDGVQALVWIGQCKGIDTAFLGRVRPFIGARKLFGFYLVDDPDPRVGNHSCKAEHLKAESDWIHANIPNAITFIVLMNLSTSSNPSFRDSYNPGNSHVDLFGISPYPCRAKANECDFDMVDRYISAAEAWAVPRSRMVPVFQAFGGGRWRDASGKPYVLPDAWEMHQLLTRWQTLVPNPAFDMTYSWGSQNGDTALEGAPHLHRAISAHINGEDLPWR